MTPTKAPVVLAVTNRQGSSDLIQQIEQQGVHVIAVSRRDQARAVLQGNPRVPIVLTDENLPDGDWRDVLQDVAASGAGAEIVVCATGAEQPLRLCFELLDHGAFGLMAEPYDPDQLQWLINTATSRCKALPKTASAWTSETASEIAHVADISPQPVGST